MTPPFDDRHSDNWHSGDWRSGDDHYGDVPLARPFPPESEWLDLPLPADFPMRPRHEFVDDVLRCLHEEALLDAQLHAFDRDLPRELLQAHTVPEPGPGFVARTLAAVRDDRRTHWHHLLARYVAPEPSPQFVARTLESLAALPATAVDPIVAARSAGGRRWRRLAWPLLAAAAAVLLWTVFAAAPPPPLELRVVRDTPPAFAYAYAESPLATVLATHTHTMEPDALATVSADGVWLLLAEAR